MRRLWLRPVGCALLVVALVYGATLTMLPVRSFWGNDTENKFLLLKSIVASGYRDFSIRWPGSALDPGLEFQPLPPPWSVVRDGKVYSVYSPVFALLSSFPFRAFGFAGLLVLPFCASLLLFAGVARIASRLGTYTAAMPVAIGVAALCTPLWFYGVQFWEHSVGVCAATWSVAYALDWLQAGKLRSLVIAGLCAGIGIWFRDELYLFAAVQLALLLASQRVRARTAVTFIGAMIAGLVPLWLLQWRTLGAPFGFHLEAHALSVSGVGELLATRAASLQALLVACSDQPGTSLVLAAPYLVPLVMYPRLSERWFHYTLPVLALLALGSPISVLWGYTTAESTMTWTYQTNALFSTTPLLALGLVRHRGTQGAWAAGSDRAAKHVRGLALGYALLYALLAPSAMSFSGIHWGNRFLLVLYPLFAALAAANLVAWWRDHRSAWGRAALLVAAVVSLAAQCWSIALLNQKKEFTSRLNEMVALRAPSAIVTNVWWAPQELFLVFHDRPIFLLDPSANYETLLARLAAGDQETFLLVTQASNVPGATLVGHIDDGRLGLFGVRLFEARTRP